MTEIFLLPDLGEGLPEAEIVQWLVAEGDTVTLNQPLAEVETAKAIVELPSPYAGTVGTLHVAAGDVVPVGDPLISIETAPQAAQGSGLVAADEDEEEADAAPGPNLVGYGAVARSAERPRRRMRVHRESGHAAADTAVLEAAPHDVITHDPEDNSVHERPRSTPPVRALARRLGVDLALVAASGSAEVITREDVEAYAAAVTDVDGAVAQAASRETRTPIRGVRKHTAEAMVASAFTAPHVTTFLTVDVTATIELIESLGRDRHRTGARIGVTAVVAKAVCLALAAHPALNSRWDAEAGEIVEFHGVNLGIAAATARGLLVPNIRDADGMSLPALAEAIAALTERARAGKTAPEALRQGTFSLTNVGVFGVDAGTPILNPGEAGILAIGAVRRQPWEYRNEIALRDVMTLALSFDHRLVDGEQGAKFLAEVGGVLREPGRAMLLR